MKIVATISGENPKKFEVIGSDKIIHLPMQFSMLIPNRVVLLHKNLGLIMKKESH
jgi:hypothetical protein